MNWRSVSEERQRNHPFRAARDCQSIEFVNFAAGIASAPGSTDCLDLTFGFQYGVEDFELRTTSEVGHILDDQTGDLKQQMDEINADNTMAQDMKDRMIKSLKAMIPSDNNKKIAEDLIKDPTYGEKIKLLESSEE